MQRNFILRHRVAKVARDYYDDNGFIEIETPMLICKGNNQGGYKLVEVFGKNFNKVLNSFVKKGLPKQVKSIVNDAMLKEYFPHFLLADKENRLNATSYVSESWIKSLAKEYYASTGFYLYVLPAYFFNRSDYQRWLGSVVGRLIK